MEVPDAVTAAALAARHGDAAGQEAFVRATQVEVWRFVAALVDPASADDLTQETYLRALRALPAFHGRSSARTWLLAIARRVCADHVRALVRRRRLDSRVGDRVAPAPDGSGLVTAVDLLRRLSPDRRAAVVLTQVLGLSYTEAAEIERVPVGTIRSRVARARAELVDGLRLAASA